MNARKPDGEHGCADGVVGRVNISAATYELVRDRFACTSRGELEVKGKGRVGMYFVEADTPAD